MRGLFVGAVLVLMMVACQRASDDRPQSAAVAGDWLSAHNAGLADWAAGFYAPDAVIRDADGVTFRGAAAAWERLTSGLYRYEVLDAAWTDADTLRWVISATPVQFFAPPRHYELTVRDGQITGFLWFPVDYRVAATSARSSAPANASWPLSLATPLLGSAGALWLTLARRRGRVVTAPRLSVIEPLRALAEARRGAT